MPKSALPPETYRSVEAAFREISSALRAEAPKDYARVVELLRELKSGKASGAELKRLTLDVLRWQLQLQRKDVEAQRTRFAPHVQAKVPAALEADAALAALLALFDQAIAQTRGKVQETPMTTAQRAALDKATEAARAAVERAEQAIARSTLGIPMVTLKEQPVSKSGVRLAPVEPAPRTQPKSAAHTTPSPKGTSKSEAPRTGGPRSSLAGTKPAPAVKRPASPGARPPQPKR